MPGSRFAKATRIDKAAAKVQGFANVHRTLFLVIVFAFVAAGLAWNIYRLTVVYHRQPVKRTATEMQDSILRERHRSSELYVQPPKRTMTMSIMEKINLQATEVHASGHPLPARCSARRVLHLRPVPHRKGRSAGPTLQTTEFLNPELPEATLRTGRHRQQVREHDKIMRAGYRTIPPWTTLKGTNPMKTRKK